mmetsp:Transcript_79276/g.212048  ORF Transcript_79276/g.212048 Transcript_79276/m.212048 type:complete len:215 (+) Transcript_79276:225-869(+)
MHLVHRRRYNIAKGPCCCTNFTPLALGDQRSKSLIAFQTSKDALDLSLVAPVVRATYASALLQPNVLRLELLECVFLALQTALQLCPLRLPDGTGTTRQTSHSSLRGSFLTQSSQTTIVLLLPSFSPHHFSLLRGSQAPFLASTQACSAYCSDNCSILLSSRPTSRSAAFNTLVTTSTSQTTGETSAPVKGFFKAASPHMSFCRSMAAQSNASS